MKNEHCIFFYISMLMFALIFTSCQEEFEELPNSQDQTTITASSSTAQLIIQASSNDGSFDNIVDGSSCIAIAFPYTVKVNGMEITITSVEDLRLIEVIFDELDDDDDILELVFPIHVTLSDFSEVTINGINGLRELAEECVEGGDDDDIECIDFVYPLNFSTFDSDNNQSGSILIESDRDMRRFFHDLGENDLVSLDFPVRLKLYDGTEVSVSSHAELAAAITSAKNTCDEDDDDDYNDDDFNEEYLNDYLTDCPFMIREVKSNAQDQTDQYVEYVMGFEANGVVKVFDRQGNTYNGTWNSRVGEERVFLNLSFETLVDFSLEWAVYEVGEGKLKLFVGDENKIIMRRFCDFQVDATERLQAIVQTCSWEIAKIKVNGESLDRFLAYDFKFLSNNVLTLSNGEMVSEGTWEVKLNGDGFLVLVISIAAEQDISLEWPIEDVTNERLKFELPETGTELVIEQKC